MKKTRICALLVLTALVCTLFTACTDSRTRKFEEAIGKYGYEAAGDEYEETGGDSSGEETASGANKELDEIRKIQQLISSQQMYINEELDDETEFMNILYLVKTESEDDVKTLFDYYSKQYAQMDESVKREKDGIVEYINYGDVYYLEKAGDCLIKGQCSKKVLESHEKMLTEAGQALKEQ